MLRSLIEVFLVEVGDDVIEINPRSAPIRPRTKNTGCNKLGVELELKSQKCH